jgi:hypothetical protein
MTDVLFAAVSITPAPDLSVSSSTADRADDLTECCAA